MFAYLTLLPRGPIGSIATRCGHRSLASLCAGCAAIDAAPLGLFSVRGKAAVTRLTLPSELRPWRSRAAGYLRPGRQNPGRAMALAAHHLDRASGALMRLLSHALAGSKALHRALTVWLGSNEQTCHLGA